MHFFPVLLKPWPPFGVPIPDSSDGFPHPDVPSRRLLRRAFIPPWLLSYAMFIVFYNLWMCIFYFQSIFFRIAGNRRVWSPLVCLGRGGANFPCFFRASGSYFEGFCPCFRWTHFQLYIGRINFGESTNWLIRIFLAFRLIISLPLLIRSIFFVFVILEFLDFVRIPVSVVFLCGSCRNHCPHDSYLRLVWWDVIKSTQDSNRGRSAQHRTEGDTLRYFPVSICC